MCLKQVLSKQSHRWHVKRMEQILLWGVYLSFLGGSPYVAAKINEAKDFLEGQAKKWKNPTHPMINGLRMIWNSWPFWLDKQSYIMGHEELLFHNSYLPFQNWIPTATSAGRIMKVAGLMVKLIHIDILCTGHSCDNFLKYWASLRLVKCGCPTHAAIDFAISKMSVWLEKTCF